MIILSFGFAVFSVQVFVSPQGIADWVLALFVKLESLVMLLCNPKFFEQYSVPTWHHLSMEGGKTVSSVVPALLEEADRLWMQRELLAELRRGCGFPL